MTFSHIYKGLTVLFNSVIMTFQDQDIEDDKEEGPNYSLRIVNKKNLHHIPQSEKNHLTQLRKALYNLGFERNVIRSVRNY